MTCEDSANITFELYDTHGTSILEIRPRSMQFDRTKGKFDICKAEFSQEIADEIRPYIENTESVMRQPLSIILKIDGKDIYRLLWVPDGLRFTDNALHAEFHDPQKYLTRGKIDYRKRNVKLKEAYDYVFENRNTSGTQMFSGIEYTVPDSAFEELVTTGDGVPGYTPDPGDDFSEDFEEARYERKNEEQNNIYNIIDGRYAIDFDKKSPWECIVELNEKFGCYSWADPSGKLIIGSRSADSNQRGYIAAPDDSRVLKLTDYEVNAPRDPVVKSVIDGGWLQDPDEGLKEQLGEYFDWNRGTKDFRVEAVAKTKTQSVIGQEIFDKQTEAGMDSLEAIAARKMQIKQREQNTGYVDILPEFSGNISGDVRTISVGDVLVTVPPDKNSDFGDTDSIITGPTVGLADNIPTCDSNIKEEMFDIVGVTHELSSDGSWNLRLDVVKVLDDELGLESIETELRFYDPQSDRYITDDVYSAD